MTDTRGRILARLSASTCATVPKPALPVRRYRWDQVERLERFRRMLESFHGEVYEVGRDWPTVLAGRLRDAGVTRLAYGPDGPDADALVAGWPSDGPLLVPHDAPIEACRDVLFNSTEAGFTSCRAGIAETGSLVLWTSASEPRLLSLVPPIHCVLLDAARIISTLHELMVDEHWRDGLPTNALLISGPSKSADIEQTLAYGVHGPARLIVLVDTSSCDARST